MSTGYMTTENHFEIHDLLIDPIDVDRYEGETRWKALSGADHLLRRFGQADVFALGAGCTKEMRVRSIADEVLVLLSGAAEFTWLDQRTNSPTLNAKTRRWIDQPSRLLVPFGVALGIRAGDEVDCLILRLATHSDTEDPPAQDRGE